ncbi:MAG: hypothetical protein KDE33_02320 [Bacteroidetes bacterium]|nr:hypothetical protein [Bacteroidota bacterium]
MIIVVNHKIANPEKFWTSAQESLPKLPESGVQRVLQVLPNETYPSFFRNFCKPRYTNAGVAKILHKYYE